jgi:hypothetical protein
MIEKIDNWEYSYENCGDAIYDSLNQKAESINSDLKSRESFLKTIPISGIQILDESTGEMITVYPPAKSSTTTIAVTLK